MAKKGSSIPDCISSAANSCREDILPLCSALQRAGCCAAPTLGSLAHGKHEHTGGNLVKGTEMTEGVEHLLYENKVRELFSLGTEQLRRHHYKHLMKDSKECGAKLLPRTRKKPMGTSKETWNST